MSVILKTEALSKQFNTGSEIIHALKDVNINIQSGKLTILRGRSGSGKTTLMNLLGAIDMPTEGKIFLNNMDITEMTNAERDKVRRKDIGFVFQSGGLISNMTAYENVEFALRIVNFDSGKRRERVEECLKLVGLSKRMNHMPQELSGGEQQRVAIARAMVHNPKIIFADEPTAALDTSMGLQVVRIFKNMVENSNMTVVMSTHDPSMMEIADYVHSLRDGEIENE
jgi:putative ABC transport system ATP-binding protein